MSETVAGLLVLVGAVYFGIGVLFAIAFVIRGAQEIDPQAVGGSWGFRLAILPATATLWPLLLKRWVQGTPPPEEHSPHRNAATSQARSGGGR